MAKEKPHPLVLICMNCKIIKQAFLPVMPHLKHNFNLVPFNCPVARGLQTICPEGHNKEAIKDLHHEFNIVRQES